MDKELKAKWVEALRSGKYKQARATLRYDGHFCCLGVLLEISGAGSWEGAVYEAGDWFSEADLCDGGREHFQIESVHHNKLVHMNDGERGERQHSFAEIADYIEANL